MCCHRQCWVWVPWVADFCLLTAGSMAADCGLVTCRLVVRIANLEQVSWNWNWDRIAGRAYLGFLEFTGGSSVWGRLGPPAHERSWDHTSQKRRVVTHPSPIRGLRVELLFWLDLRRLHLQNCKARDGGVYEGLLPALRLLSWFFDGGATNHCPSARLGPSGIQSRQWNAQYKVWYRPLVHTRASDAPWGVWLAFGHQ